MVAVTDIDVFDWFEIAVAYINFSAGVTTAQIFTDFP